MIQDLTCIECDYDLTGLDASSRCPECGMPLSKMVHHDGTARYQYSAKQRAFEAKLDLIKLWTLGLMTLFLAGGGLLLTLTGINDMGWVYGLMLGGLAGIATMTVWLDRRNQIDD